MSDDDTDEEMYSITSSQTFYKKSRSRTSNVADRRPSPPKFTITSSAEDRRVSTTYLPVTKWAVDYNNKNYVRSKCNKHIGLHRRKQGRPFKFQVEYDNNFHGRSKVNAPKGLHRRRLEIKRKYVPDDDDLQDATGWEFEYGPEFDQLEQDVPFIPEGRIVARGCYRWFGVKRNDSDCDIKPQEVRENLLNEELEEELKYGHEFLQADLPHMSLRRNRQYSRGGYRCYEVPRNVFDLKEEELASALQDPEWRRKYHMNGIRYLDVDMCDYGSPHHGSEHRMIKGKPFKRTILNKVYELRKEVDPRDMTGRHATRVSLVPGEGEKTLYEGRPDRPFGIKKTPSMRSIFKKKSKHHEYRSEDDNEYEEYEHHEYERSESRERYHDPRHEYEDRPHRMENEKQWTRESYEEYEPRPRASSSRWYEEEHVFTVQPEEDDRRGFHGVHTEDKPKHRASSSRTFDDRYEYPAKIRVDDRRRFHDIHAEDKPKHRATTSRTFDERYEYPGKTRDEPVLRTPRHESKRRESSGVTREDFEIWRENAEKLKKKRESEVKQTDDRKAREQKRRESFREYNAKRSKTPEEVNRLVKGERSKEKKNQFAYLDQGAREAATEMKRRKSDDYDHGIRNFEKVKESKRKSREKAAEEYTPGVKKFLDQVPPHVEKRVKEIEESMQKLREDRVETKPTSKNISRSDDHVYKDRQSNKTKVDSIRKLRDLETEEPSEKEKGLEKLPPHVEKRVKEIQDKMDKKFEKVEKEFKKDKEDIKGRSSADDIFKVGKEVPKAGGSADSIDLLKHKEHPDDSGKAHSSEHEKYVTKDGSEYWVKKEEKFSQLHHKDSR